MYQIFAKSLKKKLKIFINPNSLIIISVIASLIYLSLNYRINYSYKFATARKRLATKINPFYDFFSSKSGRENEFSGYSGVSNQLFLNKSIIKNIFGPTVPLIPSVNRRILQQLDIADTLSNVVEIRSELKRKTILRLGTYNFDFLGYADGSACFKDCSIDECQFVSDFEMRRKADAILMSELSYRDFKQLLPKPSDQIWIVQQLEPPTQSKIDVDMFGDLINWTASYRADSTIPIPYLTLFPRNSKHLQSPQAPTPQTSTLNPTRSSQASSNAGPYTDRKLPSISATLSTIFVSKNWTFFSGRQPDTTSSPRRSLPLASRPAISSSEKKGKVAWVVSNCNSHNLRWEYAQELSRHIQVDIYGECGIGRCDKDGCFKKLGRIYKFYLAFENSNCADYISEKFLFNALAFGMVPIVMGASRAEYEQLGISGSSFLHVDDFEDPSHLASFLRHLDVNSELYQSFWRSTDDQAIVHLSQTKYFCRLCALLHLADVIRYKRFYRDYGRWWNVCRT